jgi:archaellum component FlaF (FlaF/FlaG flagellin family)
MGFSVVAAVAIIGVSALVALEVIVGTTIPTLTEVHEAYDEMRDRAIEQVQTDITITNAVWNDPNTEITVENTGSITFNTSNCNILLNGFTKEFTCSVSYLHPEQTALFNISIQAVNGDIIKIVTPNGVSDYHTF